MDGLTLAISQGSLRHGGSAGGLSGYSPSGDRGVSRNPQALQRTSTARVSTCINGVNITDAFMEAVRAGEMFNLRSPKTDEPMRQVDARQLWQRILETRVQTGEPCCCSLTRSIAPCRSTSANPGPESHDIESLRRNHPGDGHATISDRDRTAVCCLSSLNIETWDEWNEVPGFVEDILRISR